jgi:prolipoprotein diacylglyceryl transferase
VPAMNPTFIPSPPQSLIHLGPIPLRGYALCIILGVIAAIMISERRWIARGGSKNLVVDIAVWAIPFGLVGGRLYHVLTDYQLYFGPQGNPVEALYIWRGGLGIWGAISLGALGVWIGCRRHGVHAPAFADAIAPGVATAQAFGRWGNWFNQELYGRATTVPWAVEIDPAHRPPDTLEIATYHPTFLYESLWCLGVAAFVVWADRRFRLGHGRVFALYVVAYTMGRGWIEWLRVDPAHTIFGVRLNDWTAGAVGLAAMLYLLISARRRPGRETPEELYRHPKATRSSMADSTVVDDAVNGDGTAVTTPGEAADLTGPSRGTSGIPAG